jgi:hypothetical protein
MSTKEVRIRPAGWESAPAEEQFALSDMDHTMPKIYVQIVEVFKLAPLFDKAKVVDSMAKGLGFTLSQFPILAGGLKMDAENGRLWVTKRKDSEVSLFVQDLEETFSSFGELDRTDFPATTFKGYMLLPKVVTEKQLFSPLGETRRTILSYRRFRSISSKAALSSVSLSTITVPTAQDATAFSLLGRRILQRWSMGSPLKRYLKERWTDRVSVQRNRMPDDGKNLTRSFLCLRMAVDQLLHHQPTSRCPNWPFGCGIFPRVRPRN